MRAYLIIFAPVFAAGVFTGWVIPWFVRNWRASTVLIAEVKAAADDQPVPYWPTVKPDAIRQGPPASTEWDRIVRAIKEDW